MKEAIQKSIKQITSNFPFYCVKLKEDQYNIITEKEIPKVDLSQRKRKAFSKGFSKNVSSKVQKFGSEFTGSKATIHAMPSPARRVQFEVNSSHHQIISEKKGVTKAVKPMQLNIFSLGEKSVSIHNEASKFRKELPERLRSCEFSSFKNQTSNFLQSSSSSSV